MVSGGSFEIGLASGPPSPGFKSECLDRMVLLGEAHLRRAIDQYMEHYHLERTHQGLDNTLIDGVPECGVGAVQRHERLGGMLSSYYREAA